MRNQENKLIIDTIHSPNQHRLTQILYTTLYWWRMQNGEYTKYFTHMGEIFEINILFIKMIIKGSHNDIIPTLFKTIPHAQYQTIFDNLNKAKIHTQWHLWQWWESTKNEHMSKFGYFKYPSILSHLPPIYHGLWHWNNPPKSSNHTLACKVVMIIVIAMLTSCGP
jgi:hypothetical protein